MPAKKKQRKPINLLPIDKFKASTIGRILQWTLSTFRAIVIIVEIIVVGGFLMRFKIDAENANLDKQINQKASLVGSYTEFENDYREIQAKIEVFNEFANEEDNKSPIVKSIVSKLPEAIRLVSIRINAIGDIDISGESISESSISQLIAGLKQDEKFTNILLTKIGTKKDSPFLEFSLTIKQIEKVDEAEMLPEDILIEEPM